MCALARAACLQLRAPPPPPAAAAAPSGSAGGLLRRRRNRLPPCSPPPPQLAAAPASCTPAAAAAPWPSCASLRPRRRATAAAAGSAAAAGGAAGSGGGSGAPAAAGSSGGALASAAAAARRFLADQFLPVALLCALALGALAPATGLAAASVHLSLFTTFSIFVIQGLSLRRGEAAAALRARGAVAYGAAAVLLITPLAALVAVRLPLQPPALALGLAVFCCVPTTLSSGVTLTQARARALRRPLCSLAAPRLQLVRVAA